MIIVSQDKTVIANFRNIESIYIVAVSDGTGQIPYKIYYETSSKREELGEYKTEERAKQVLNKIIGFCADNSKTNLTENLMLTMYDKNFAIKTDGINCVFYMPEE